MMIIPNLLDLKNAKIIKKKKKTVPLLGTVIKFIRLYVRELYALKHRVVVLL